MTESNVSDGEIGAGKAWFDENFNGCPDTETLVEGILRAAAKVRASREGGGEWAAKAERYFLRLQAVYDQPHEDNPDWTNLGVALKHIREAASPIPATGGEKE